MAHVWLFEWMGMSKTAPTIGTHLLEAPGPAARLICSPTMVTMRTSWGFANSEPTRPFVGFGWLWRLAWSLQNSILHHSSILEIYLKFVIEDVSRKLQAIHKMSWANPSCTTWRCDWSAAGSRPTRLQAIVVAPTIPDDDAVVLPRSKIQMTQERRDQQLGHLLQKLSGQYIHQYMHVNRWLMVRSRWSKCLSGFVDHFFVLVIFWRIAN